MARLTLWGFNQYDPTLFDGIDLPAEAEKDILIDTIMMECGDCYTYYQHPVYLKKNIELWFKRMKKNFSRSFEALYTEYKPLENYDRQESYTDIGKESGTNSSNANSSAYSNGTREDKISAFNSSTYQPDANTNSTNSSNNSQTVSGADSKDTRSEHTARIHGNIGVTTSQQMLEAELELRRYDIYLDIARQFEHRFITQIY